MKLMVKAAGPRTIVLGSTGCMYVANTTYYTTPWVVPWMHTQLGSAGSAALGAAAGLKVLMRKGKLAQEPIKVGAIEGLSGPIAKYGVPIRHGIELAAEAVNADDKPTSGSSAVLSPRETP